MSEQVERLKPPKPDGTVIYSVKEPFKPTGGLRLLGGNLSTDHSAVLKLAGVEGGLDNNIFRGRAKVFDGEQALLKFLDSSPNKLSDGDMVVVRYEGPVGGPGMPEMLDSTSRITTICREKKIVVGLMTDGRFSGGSVGLVIGHVGPEAAVEDLLRLEDGDNIVVNLNTNELNCEQLYDPETYSSKIKLENKLDKNSNFHPAVGEADTRLLNRMRCLQFLQFMELNASKQRSVDFNQKLNGASFLAKNKYK